MSLPRQKPAPDFGQRRTKLDLFNNVGFVPAHGIEISVDLIAVTEIERDHGVYVCQSYGWVILVDLFWSRALQESLDQRKERDTSIGYPADTLPIKAKRRWSRFDIDTRHDASIIPRGRGRSIGGFGDAGSSPALITKTVIMDLWRPSHQIGYDRRERPLASRNNKPPGILAFRRPILH